MWKYAGELRVGDVWTERTGGRGTRSYRVIAIAPGLALTTIMVTGSCVTTGRRRTMDFFPVNRVEVRKEFDIVRTKRRVRLPDVASTDHMLRRRFRSMHCASAPAGQASTPHANDELARTAVCRGAKPASIGRAFPWKCRGAESDLARPRREL